MEHNTPYLPLKERVEYFMYPFMFELEMALKERIEELKTLTFHSDEANTDRELKEYLKEFIESSLNKLPNTSKSFICDYQDSDKGALCFRYDYFNDISISKVYLPDEIDDHIKSQVKKQHKVYTNPDLTLGITNDKETFYIPVELKSTKNNSIPGSSIQQITPTEWVIFVKHTDKGKVVVTTGQYINAVNSTMQFPDRSPRPQVAFNELEEWNKNFRNYGKGVAEENVLTVTISEEVSQYKVDSLKDWQGKLVDRWLKVIQQNSVKKNEPWFSNTIRRYTSQFISMYENLNEVEKEKLKDTLNTAIQLYSKNNNFEEE